MSDFEPEIIKISEAMVGDTRTSEFIIALINKKSGTVISYKYPFFDREEAADKLTELISTKETHNWHKGFPPYCYGYEQEKQYEITFH